MRMRVRVDVIYHGRMIRNSAQTTILSVLFGTLKVQSFTLTEVRDCDLLIVVTSSTFLKRKDMLKENSS